MYRTRSMEKNNEQFVEKLCDLPVVNDALDKLGSLYTETKERNRLFRFTLQTAESGLGFVYNTAKPVVKKFEKPIETLNGLAVHQLEKLEQDYPIIAQPTDVVLQQTKETCTAAVKPIADRVKPITDRVGSATKYSVDKVQSARQFTVGTIEGVATYGLNKVNDVKTYGVNKVIAVSDVGSKQMSKVLDNQASQLLLTQVDLIMNVADGYIDKYLPPDESEDKSPSKSKNKESDEKGQQTALISKAWNMGYKVRRRAYNRAAKELKAVRMRSVDTLSKMNPVDLMEYARTNLDGMREKVHYVWDEINKPAEQVMKEELENNEKNIKNMTYQHRFIATARHLTLTIKAGATAMNLSIETVPGPFRPFVIQALEVAQSVFKMFLARPEHMNNGTEEVHKSLPSLKPTPDQAPSSTKSQSSVKASTSKESNAENNSHEVKTIPAKVTSPAKAPEAKVNSPAKAEEDKNKKFERNPSTSSSEHQDDQTYAEPQDDSPDSYE